MEEQQTIAWHAPEFRYREKSADWYWILGIVVIAGILIAIVVDNLLFAILIGIGGFVFGIYGSKHPDTLSCELAKKGLRVNDKLYPYGSIDTFWIDDTREGEHKLLLTLRHRFAMQVMVPIEGIDPDIVRENLVKHVHEEEQRESFAERLMELIHF